MNPLALDQGTVSDDDDYDDDDYNNWVTEVFMKSGGAPEVEMTGSRQQKPAKATSKLTRFAREADALNED